MSSLNFINKIAAKISSGKRPPLEPFYVYILSALIGFAIADLSILKYRPQMLPTQAPPSKPTKKKRSRFKSIASYKEISRRNMFDHKGEIPPALSLEKKEESTDGPAVPSKLPLKLLGTIVHGNPKKSIVTVNISNRNKTESFKVDESIPGMVQFTKVERRKVTFRNLANNRLEYIEIPKDGGITFGLSGPKKPAKVSSVKKAGDFSFQISRSDLDKYTSDLPNILKQARMVPNILPGSGGKIDGFRFVSIKPDSIFEKLGFKPGDIIKGVNGEPVSNPTQAMEMYQALKTTDNLKLNVARDGKDEEFDYRIE